MWNFPNEKARVAVREQWIFLNCYADYEWAIFKGNVPVGTSRVAQTPIESRASKLLIRAVKTGYEEFPLPAKVPL